MKKQNKTSTRTFEAQLLGITVTKRFASKKLCEKRSAEMRRRAKTTSGKVMVGLDCHNLPICDLQLTCTSQTPIPLLKHSRERCPTKALHLQQNLPSRPPPRQNPTKKVVAPQLAVDGSAEINTARTASLLLRAQHSTLLAVAILMRARTPRLIQTAFQMASLRIMGWESHRGRGT